jgi:hypothetical protein
MQTTLTYHELRCLIAHASKDETRQHISGVYFDSKKGVVASTDGHRLALRVSDPYGTTPALFPLSQMALVLRCMAATDAVEVTEEEATVCDRNSIPLVTIPLKASGEQFPPYHTVVPGGVTKQEPVVVAMDSRLMCHAVKHLTKISGSETRQVHMRTFGKVDPVEFTVQAAGSIWAILVMLQRSDTDVILGNVIGERVREKPRAKPEPKASKTTTKPKATKPRKSRKAA